MYSLFNAGYSMDQFTGMKKALILAPSIANRHAKNVTTASKYLLMLGCDHVDIISQYTHGFMRKRRFADDGDFIMQSVSSSDISSIFQKSAGRMCGEDLFFLYVTGHGNHHKNEVYLDMHDGRLWTKEIADAVDKTIRPAHCIIIADQCYGYNFIEDLVLDERTLGICASAENQASCGNTFPQVFFPALASERDLKKAFALAYLNDMHRMFGIQSPQFMEHYDGEIWVTPDLQRLPAGILHESDFTAKVVLNKTMRTDHWQTKTDYKSKNTH